MPNEVLEGDFGDYFKITLVKPFRIVFQQDNSYLLRIRHYS